MKAVVVYADESGTHDRDGVQPGSGYPIIAGFAAPRTQWESFCLEWKSVLDSYGVRYFHAKELREMRSVVENKRLVLHRHRNNQYLGWTVPKMEKYLLSLAKVAGKGNKVPIHGSIRMRLFNEEKKKAAPEAARYYSDPYKYSMYRFFMDFHRETNFYWGNFAAPVTFFFDQNDDPRWNSALHEMYSIFAKSDRRFAGLAFGDKRMNPHLPLQAADLLAYRTRQWADKLDNGARIVPEKIDDYLLRRRFAKAKALNPTLGPHLYRTTLVKPGVLPK